MLDRLAYFFFFFAAFFFFFLGGFRLLVALTILMITLGVPALGVLRVPDFFFFGL